MVDSELIESLKNFYESIKEFQRNISESKTIQITNRDLKDGLNHLASVWFSDFSKKLLPYGLDKALLVKYDSVFKSILKLSSNNSRKTSYERLFNAICKTFRDEIIIFMQTDATNTVETTAFEFSSEVSALLEKVPDKEENEYLSEALGCWENGFLKAAVVLLWCCAIDRIHNVIEQKGLNIFNQTSVNMTAQTTGRYKKFNKSQNVQSISDLRMVFDSDILWVLEGMQMIDTNQKTRLSSCFDMRCHSGHPGEAPVTKYNVISCFSDIVEIILANPKFSLENKE